MNKKNEYVSYEYWDDGTISNITPYVDDKKHGIEYSFYVYGGVHFETRWVEGKKHGEMIEYTEHDEEIKNVLLYLHGDFIRFK